MVQALDLGTSTYFPDSQQCTFLLPPFGSKITIYKHIQTEPENNPDPLVFLSCCSTRTKFAQPRNQEPSMTTRYRVECECLTSGLRIQPLWDSGKLVTDSVLLDALKTHRRDQFIGEGYSLLSVPPRGEPTHHSCQVSACAWSLSFAREWNVTPAPTSSPPLSGGVMVGWLRGNWAMHTIRPCCCCCYS